MAAKEIGAVLYRPSTLPELAGTLVPLDDELAGELSKVRLGLAALVLAGLGYGVWSLLSRWGPA